MESKYGKCDRCGSDMMPVWFTEEEYKRGSVGSLIKTGRKRRACSHLECPSCFRSYCVDDSFDGRWY